MYCIVLLSECFQGHKQCLSAIGRYVLVAAAAAWDVGSGSGITTTNTSSSGTNQPPVNSTFPVSGGGGGSKRSSVIIYDLRSKFITMNAPLPSGETVVRILQDGGAATAHVLTSSGACVDVRKGWDRSSDFFFKSRIFTRTLACT